MDELATQDAYLEVEQSGRWSAFILDLPGCFAYGADEPEALSGLTDAIPGYYQWLRAHDEYTPEVRGPWRVIPRETFRTSRVGDHEVHAFFTPEAQPTDDEELDWRLALLDWAHADLAALLRQIPPSAMNLRPADGGWSVRQVVDHAAQVAVRYVSHLDEPFNPPSIEHMPGSPLERLNQVHVACMARLRATTDLQRVRVLEDRGERWSLAKVLRRGVSHLRDHTAQIERSMSISGFAPRW